MCEADAHPDGFCNPLVCRKLRTVVEGDSSEPVLRHGRECGDGGSGGVLGVLGCRWCGEEQRGFSFDEGEDGPVLVPAQHGIPIPVAVSPKRAHLGRSGVDADPVRNEGAGGAPFPAFSPAGLASAQQRDEYFAQFLVFVDGSVNGFMGDAHPGVDVCFVHLYSSWERARNENTNGLLRQ